MSGQPADQDRQFDPRKVINSLLLQYKLNLQAGNRSAKTISWYFDILEKYFSFLETNKLLKPIEELGKAELEAYVLYLQGRTTRWESHKHMKPAQGGLSPFSIQGQVRAIKAFFGWLYRDDRIEDNKLANYPLPKVPNKHMPTLTPDEVKKLLSALDKSLPIDFRNYMIILLLYDTGVRISELINMKISDIDQLNHTIEVTGKGQKQRYVFISNFTRKALKKYLANARPGLNAIVSPYVFPDRNGNTIRLNCIQQMLKRLSRKAGLTAEVHAHVFRHSYGTQAIANGADPFAIKETMGHSSLTTTLKYTQQQPQDLMKKHARFSPVNSLANIRFNN